MNARAILTALALAVGGGCANMPKLPSVARGAATADEDVVVEIRVKVPASAASALGAGASTVPQGGLFVTQNPFDLAIEGAGYFQAMTPDGVPAYTRDGSFGQNALGQLTTRSGYVLTPEVVIPPDATAISVGTDGIISVVLAGTHRASVNLGQITLVRFPNPGWLRREPDGFYYETPESGIPTTAAPGTTGLGLVRQGFRERHADQFAQTLIQLVRDMAHDQGNGVRVAVKP